MNIKNIKDWLKERSDKPQFEFITANLVKRLKDGSFFKTGKTNYTTVDGTWHITAFYLDGIHVDVIIPQLAQTMSKWAINDFPFGYEYINSQDLFLEKVKKNTPDGYEFAKKLIEQYNEKTT